MVNCTEKLEFTYCGDLVGISSIYSNAPDAAYDLLSQFYNTAYRALENYQKRDLDCKVYMFSDSLIVTGGNADAFVRSMCDLYMSNLNHSTLLRGGIVSGRLDFDLRVSRENFEKKLPRSDKLAKASALEKSVKGARFVIEPELAAQLLARTPRWRTLQGYLGDLMENFNFELERSIAPLPTGGGFEVLYPVFLNVPFDNGVGPSRVSDELIARNLARMEYLAAASSSEVIAHYQATKQVLEHSQLRRKHMPVRNRDDT
ncbi:MAG: hypothetical protein IAE94_06305 [Chthoniobacterales bacterium]|nr:hypothetical protein [Chthoniobacterales bacterium]